MVLYGAEDRLDVIWQPKSTQDLLWDLINYSSDDDDHVSLTSLLQGVSYISHKYWSARAHSSQIN